MGDLARSGERVAVGMLTSLHSRWSALKSGGDYSTERSLIAEGAHFARYTAAMPVDVAAEVMTNRPLSADYNVLALRAPEIARIAAPGQFVMVKAGLGHDPLLRRPFSVFEILRDRDGAPSGLSLLNKRIGPSTALVYSAAARTAPRLPGTARPSVLARRATDRGVDGRGRRRAGAVRHAGRVASRARRALHALLRGAPGARSCFV